MPDQTAKYRAGNSPWEQAAQFSRCHTSAVLSFRSHSRAAPLESWHWLSSLHSTPKGARLEFPARTGEWAAHAHTPAPSWCRSRPASQSVTCTHPEQWPEPSRQLSAPSPTFTFHSSGLCNWFEVSLQHHRTDSLTSLVSTKHSSTTLVTEGRKPVQDSTAISNSSAYGEGSV